MPLKQMSCARENPAGRSHEPGFRGRFDTGPIYRLLFDQFNPPIDEKYSYLLRTGILSGFTLTRGRLNPVPPQIRVSLIFLIKRRQSDS